MSNPTTPFSWQMPTATDLVTDLPADFEVFGQAVATSMGDLLGGSSGYILSKASATDMDFTWIANDQGDITGVTAGNGISITSPTGPVPTVAIDTTITVDKTTAQTLTNKTLTSPALTTPTISTATTNGDVLYGTGSGALARLGIGSTSQVLTVAAGIPSWATPASGGGMTLLATTTLTGSSVTVSSLSTYKQLCFVIRLARITANGNFNCTFNSDTGSNYTWNGLKAHDGVLSSATGAAASTSMRLGFIGDSSTTTNLFGGEINVVAADQTSGVSVRSTGGFNDGTGNTAIFFNGRYFNTAVISSITLNAGASTWASGTLMTYGVN